MNVTVRNELKLAGAVAPDDHTFRLLVQRQVMTGAERSWANRYEINDKFATRGSKAIGIGAGTYASVVQIDPVANLLTVEKSNHAVGVHQQMRQPLLAS